VGTPYYASPEIWNNSQYDSKCDVWSLGCVAYQMAALRLPFEAKGMDKLYLEVTRGKLMAIPNFYSYELSRLIFHCLEK
jgi:NIMA (never in mitosis gene a)-related kinase